MFAGEHAFHYWTGASDSGRCAVLQHASVGDAGRRQRRWHAHRGRRYLVPRPTLRRCRRLGLVSKMGRRQGDAIKRCSRTDRSEPVHRPAGRRAVRARARRAARARRRDAQPHGQQGLPKQRGGERQNVGRAPFYRVKPRLRTRRSYPATLRAL